MKIGVLRKENKEIARFEKNEWDKFDKETWGEIWKYGKYSIVAKREKKIVGLLKFEYEGGVIFIKSLIVAKGMRGKGTGKKMMLKLEKIAKKLGAHKIHLYAKAEIEGFYQALGYKKNSLLPNHFMHEDHFEHVKYL